MLTEEMIPKQVLKCMIGYENQLLSEKKLKIGVHENDYFNK